MVLLGTLKYFWLLKVLPGTLRHFWLLMVLLGTLRYFWLLNVLLGNDFVLMSGHIHNQIAIVEEFRIENAFILSISTVTLNRNPYN